MCQHSYDRYIGHAQRYKGNALLPEGQGMWCRTSTLRRAWVNRDGRTLDERVDDGFVEHATGNVVPGL